MKWLDPSVTDVNNARKSCPVCYLPPENCAFYRPLDQQLMCHTAVQQYIEVNFGRQSVP